MGDPHNLISGRINPTRRLEAQVVKSTNAEIWVGTPRKGINIRRERREGGEGREGREGKRTGASPPLCELSPLKESPPYVPHLVPEVREGQGGEEERQECRAAPRHPPCRPLTESC